MATTSNGPSRHLKHNSHTKCGSELSRCRTGLQSMQPIHPQTSLATLFLTACLTAVPAETNTTTTTLAVRIEKARAEKRIDRRLLALATVANELPLAEIPNGL